MRDRGVEVAVEFTLGSAMLWMIASALAIASGTVFVAWRAVRADRRRAHLGVPALASDAQHDPFADLPLGNVAPEPSGSPLFDSGAAAAVRRSRTAAAIALAVFVVGSGAALAVVLTGSASGTRGTAAATTRAGAPLELLALGHERDGDALTIHGIVRNPATGIGVSDVSVLVSLFDGDGKFMTSARGAIDNDDLAPGAGSRFTVVVPSAQDVARYRVSFRTDAGIIVHVDRRAAPGSTR